VLTDLIAGSVHLTVVLSAKRQAVDPGDTQRKNRQMRRLGSGPGIKRDIDQTLALVLTLRNAFNAPFDSILQTMKETTQIQMKTN
jgi:hypothetical protein